MLVSSTGANHVHATLLVRFPHTLPPVPANLAQGHHSAAATLLRGRQWDSPQPAQQLAARCAAGPGKALLSEKTHRIA